MTYVVIDTNVLVASLLTADAYSPTRRIVEAVFSGEIVPIVSEAILSEYLEVLLRPKFGFSPDAVNDFIAGFSEKAVLSTVEPSGTILPDADDAIFYDAALAFCDDEVRLITGNIRHFPDCPIAVTPSEFADKYLQ